MRKKEFKIFLIIVFVFSQSIICYSQSLKLVSKIPIDENALLLSGSFVVLPNGNFVFSDTKDENNQFKLINEKGKLIKGWGKMGPGPDEFGGIAELDYNDKYLAAYDAGKQCVHLFEINQNEFRKKGEIMAWEVNSFIKLYDRSVLMGGYIVSPNEKKYIIFKRDFSGKNTEYILPLEYNYGGNSLSEYRKIREEVKGVSHKGYADIYEDLLFYVSDVRLKIIKTDLKTKKIEVFGDKPRNFRPLAMDEKIRNELLQPATGRKIMDDILNKYSFVSGIFADKNFVGVIYLNRENRIQGENYFVPYYQIYDHSGKLLGEGQIEDYYTMDKFSPFFYQKSKGLLFLLSIIDSESDVKYTIYKYEISSGKG